MGNSITIFADNDILRNLESYLAISHRYEIGYAANSYTDCFEPSVNNNACAIILQVTPQMASCLDLLYDLDQPEYSPVLLMFEKLGNGTILYTMTDPAVSPLVGKIAMMFENALDGIYECNYKYIRPATLEGSDHEISKFGRHEALAEILRGCEPKEIEFYKKIYHLDLRGIGYYLFFWELQSMEYRKHQANKDIYNYVGDLLEREFDRILKAYSGGEVFHLTMNKRCIIINEIMLSSLTAKAVKFEELIRRLAVCGKNKTASCYLSEYVPNLQGLRQARDRYEKEKASLFFLRNVSVVRAGMVNSVYNAQKITLDSVMPLVQRVRNYIRYDVNNPDLLICLHQLYFNIIKPSMSYTLYYFCVASICASIVREDETANMGVLIENLAPDLLRFSSIEEQYEIMCRRISAFQAKTGGKRKTKNVIIIRAMDYIAENYDRDISVPQIANAIYVSHVYLSQISKDILGTSIISYIVNYRIECAKEKLQNTDEMIYDIAESVGFHDVKHFSKTFKRITGLSPTQYRNFVQKK